MEKIINICITNHLTVNFKNFLLLEFDKYSDKNIVFSVLEPSLEYIDEIYDYLIINNIDIPKYCLMHKYNLANIHKLSKFCFEYSDDNVFVIKMKIQYEREFKKVEYDYNMLLCSLHFINDYNLDKDIVENVFGINYEEFIMAMYTNITISKYIYINYIYQYADKYPIFKDNDYYNYVCYVNSLTENHKIFNYIDNYINNDYDRILSVNHIIIALYYNIYDPKKKIRVDVRTYSNLDIINHIPLYLQGYFDNNIITWNNLKKFLLNSYEYLCVEEIFSELTYINSYDINYYHNYDDTELVVNADKCYYFINNESNNYKINKCSLLGYLINENTCDAKISKTLFEQILRIYDDLVPTINELYAVNIENIKIYYEEFNFEEYCPDTTLILNTPYSYIKYNNLSELINIIKKMVPINEDFKDLLDQAYHTNYFDVSKYKIIKNDYCLAHCFITENILQEDITLLSVENKTYLLQFLIDQKKSR